MVRFATIGALLVFVAAGCASGTKSGGPVAHQITIVMESADGTDSDSGSTYFASQVQKRSGGRIKIELGNHYPNSDVRNEPRLVRALRSGKVQMAYIPARAWEEASPVTAFRALQAPLLVTNYPLLRRITTGPIGRSMLSSLSSIGVVGLGLVPQRLRRLFGRRPLDSAQTLHGAHIRPITSRTGELALRALGAVPVTIAGSREAGPAMASGRIDGVESETISIWQNDYAKYARYLTANVALFAKVTTIAIRRSVFERLSTQDRSILRAAARATVVHADPAAAERTDMAALCRLGVKLVTATPVDLASLRPLALRAYSTLERDATTRTDIKAIQQLKTAGAAGVSALPACAAAKAGRSGSKSAALSGTYVMTASQSEIAKAAGSHGTADNWGSFRLELHDGRFRLSDRRSGAGAPTGWSAGTYAINGDRITFTTERSDSCQSSACTPFSRPLGGAGDPPVICRWNVYRNELSFRQLPAAARAQATAHGLDSGGPPLLYAKQWQPVHVSTAAPTPPSKVVGTWVVNISEAQMKATGVGNYGFTRLVFGRKSFRISDRRPKGQPLVQGASSGSTSGTYSLRGDRLTFFIGSGRGDTPLGAHGDTPIVVLWSVYRNTLTLRQGKKNEGGASLWLDPWRRVS